MSFCFFPTLRLLEWEFLSDFLIIAYFYLPRIVASMSKRPGICDTDLLSYVIDFSNIFPRNSTLIGFVHLYLKFVFSLFLGI